MDRMAPGGGGRFAAMVASGKSPALAAFIGRRKYGKKRFQHMASAGRHRHALARAAANRK